MDSLALALGVRWRRWFPRIPLPVRLPFGGWWLARRNQIGDTVFWYRGFADEAPALRFMESFLQPGMTVVDAGAHEGYYTLLAARRVGRKGCVISFEPSPRERNALLWHVRINHCANVTVESVALGYDSGAAQLHVVEGLRTGFNSLRPPAISDRTETVSVRIERLDDSLRRLGVDHVDFIKMDVEGAELSLLQGASELLRREPRPVILAEVEDSRTAPWGYPAREIVKALRERNYEWFKPELAAGLVSLGTAQHTFEANLVAIPAERRELLPRN